MCISGRGEKTIVGKFIAKNAFEANGKELKGGRQLKYNLNIFMSTLRLERARNLKKF